MRGRVLIVARFSAKAVPWLKSIELGVVSAWIRGMVRFRVSLVLFLRASANGVDVSGLSMGFIADTPPVMSEGAWRLGLLFDEAANAEQLDRLRRFMGGEFGGVPAALGPLIGEVVGEVVAPIRFRDEDGRHLLSVGDDVDVTVADVVSPGLGPVELHNVAHPVNTNLTVGEGVGSRISLLGIEYSGDGTSGFSAPFSWAA